MTDKTPPAQKYRMAKFSVTLILAPLLAAALAGCADSGATIDDRLGRSLVSSTRYNFYDCRGLGNMTAHYTSREKTLRELIAKAEQGTGGAFVSAIAYRTEYAEARGNLYELRRASAAQNCPPPVAPVVPATPPAPARRR